MEAAGAPLKSLNPDPFPCFQLEDGTLQVWLEQREITVENRRNQRLRSDVQLSPFYIRRRNLFQLLSHLVCKSIEVLKGEKVRIPFPYIHTSPCQS